MAKHNGSCLCGAVTFEVDGDFDRFYLCHCHHCQKDTGTGHGANLFSQSAKLTWLSGEDAVASFTLAGTRHNKSFCQTCGSALPSTEIAGLLMVPVGALDSAISIKPTAHLFLSSQANWENALGHVPSFDGLPE